MATAYFGWPNDGSSPVTPSEDADNNLVAGACRYDVWYTCPGSGAVTLNALGIYMRNSAGVGNVGVRMALYDNAGNLVCQHSAGVGAGMSLGWVGEAQALSGTTTLTGGAQYRLVACFKQFDSGLASFTYHAVTGATKVVTNKTYYDGGFPATQEWDSGTTSDREWGMRATVTVADGGSTPSGIFGGSIFHSLIVR